MEQEKKKKLIYIVIALIVLVVIGIFVSYLSGNRPRNLGNLIVSGTVQQKTDESLIIDALTLRGINGNTPDQKVIKTIAINSKTPVKKQTQKDPKVLEEQQKVFLEAQKNGDLKIKPPLPFIEETASINDIVVGSYVTIKVDKDIEKNNNLSAKSILINPSSLIPNVPSSGAPQKIVGSVGWIGNVSESKFAVDRGDGTRVQVLINPGAIITRQVAKSDNEFKNELEQFKKGLMVVAPVPVRDEPVTFNDIHLGNQIEVQGIGDITNGMFADRVTLVLEGKTKTDQ